MPPTSSTFSNAQGEMQVTVVSPRVFVSRARGVLEVQMATHLLEQLESWRAIEGRELETFHDWEEVSDYTSEARMILTPWSQRNRKSIRSANLLVRTRAMALGIRLVNSLVGGHLTPHHDRATFEAQRAEAIQRRGSAGVVLFP